MSTKRFLKPKVFVYTHAKSVVKFLSDGYLCPDTHNSFAVHSVKEQLCSGMSWQSSISQPAWARRFKARAEIGKKNTAQNSWTHGSDSGIYTISKTQFFSVNSQRWVHLTWIAMACDPQIKIHLRSSDEPLQRTAHKLFGKKRHIILSV